jgi:hypothetical protein
MLCYALDYSNTIENIHRLAHILDFLYYLFLYNNIGHVSETVDSVVLGSSNPEFYT